MEFARPLHRFRDACHGPNGRAAAEYVAHDGNPRNNDANGHESEEDGHHSQGDEDWAEIDHCEHVKPPFGPGIMGVIRPELRLIPRLSAWRPHPMPLPQ